MPRTYAIVSILIASLILAPAALAIVGPLPNDNRALAQPVSAPGAFVIHNVGATLAAGEPRPCGGMASTIWFTFVAATSGTLKVRAESTPGYDTVVAVYPAGGTVRLACNDDSGGLLNYFSSQVFVPVTQGATYDIQVGGYYGDQGDAILEITPP